MSEANDVTKELPTLVAQYTKLKDKLAEAKRVYDTLEVEVKDEMATIKKQLLHFCNESGVDSVKVGDRLFYRTAKSKYYTADWGSFYQFVIENNCPDLLAKSIHQSNMQTFLQEHPDLLPKGLNVQTEYSITIR